MLGDPQATFARRACHVTATKQQVFPFALAASFGLT